MRPRNCICALAPAARRLAAVALTTFTLAVAPLAEAKVIKEAFKVQGKVQTISANIWSDPDVSPRAILIGLHGGVQHGGNFAGLAEELAPRGIVVYSLDLRGHGEAFLTAPRRPKLDYTGSTEDTVQLVEQIRLTHPKLPVFCVGESLGASVAVKALAARPKLFDGLILASVGLVPAVGHHMSATLQNIGRGFKTLGGNIDLTAHVKAISDDVRSCDEMIDDPLCRKQLSVADMMHALNYMHQAHKLIPSLDPDVPVLVLQGEDDHIIHASSTRKLYAKIPARDKSFISFPGCGHLVVTTKFLKQTVIEGVQKWLFAHSTEPALAVTAAERSSEKASPPNEPGSALHQSLQN